MKLTKQAEQRLARDLQRRPMAERETMRLLLLSSVTRQFMLVLDREKAGDRSVCDERGRTVLLLDRQAAGALRYAVLDYREDEHAFKLEPDRQTWKGRRRPETNRRKDAFTEN